MLASLYQFWCILGDVVAVDWLVRASVVKTGNCHLLVIKGFEDCEQLCQDHQLSHPTGQVEQLQLRSTPVCTGIGTDQFTQSGTVDVGNPLKVEKDIFYPAVGQCINLRPNGLRLTAYPDLTK